LCNKLVVGRQKRRLISEDNKLLHGGFLGLRRLRDQSKGLIKLRPVIRRIIENEGLSQQNKLRAGEEREKRRNRKTQSHCTMTL